MALSCSTVVQTLRMISYGCPVTQHIALPCKLKPGQIILVPMCLYQNHS